MRRTNSIINIQFCSRVSHFKIVTSFVDGCAATDSLSYDLSRDPFEHFLRLPLNLTCKKKRARRLMRVLLQSDPEVVTKSSSLLKFPIVNGFHKRNSIQECYHHCNFAICHYQIFMGATGVGHLLSSLFLERSVGKETFRVPSQLPEPLSQPA